MLADNGSTESLSYRYYGMEPQNDAQPFSEIQAQMVALLRGRIMIGYDVQKDLQVILWSLPDILQLKVFLSG